MWKGRQKKGKKNIFLVLLRSKEQPLKSDGWELVRKEAVKPSLTSVAVLSVTLFELDTDFSPTEAE